MKLDEITVGANLFHTGMPKGWCEVEHVKNGFAYIKVMNNDGAELWRGYTNPLNLHWKDPVDPEESEKSGKPLTAQLAEYVREHNSRNELAASTDGPSRLQENPHYAKGLDPWAVMQETFTPEQYKGYLKGNILKYAMRFEHKGTPVQDLNKIIDHAKELIRLYEPDDKQG